MRLGQLPYSLAAYPGKPEPHPKRARIVPLQCAHDQECSATGPGTTLYKAAQQMMLLLPEVRIAISSDD